MKNEKNINRKKNLTFDENIADWFTQQKQDSERRLGSVTHSEYLRILLLHYQNHLADINRRKKFLYLKKMIDDAKVELAEISEKIEGAKKIIEG